MFQEMFSENRHRTIAMRKNYPEKPWKTFVLTVVMVLVVVVYISCSRKETESSRSVQGTTFAMDTAITTTLYGGTEEDLSDTDRYLTDLGQKLDWRVEGSLTETFNTEHQADFSEFADMIETILDVAEKSNGAFDPTILSVSKLWDFGGDNQRRPSDEEIQTALSHVDHTKLTFSDGILSTTDTDVQLELGAVGKGYAIMEAADMLDRDRIPSALLSAGSSITTFGERPGQDGFRVGLRDPRGEADDLIGVLTVTDLSIATSGDYERYFIEDGVRYHHILDGRTGYPADSGLMSVSVIHENGTLCDALSTAGFILGLEEGMDLMDTYDAMAIFIDTDKNVYYNDEMIMDFLDFQGSGEGYTLIQYH